MSDAEEARRQFDEESWGCQIDLCGPVDRLAASLPGMICSFRLRPDGHGYFPYAGPAIFDLFGLRPEEVAEDASPLLTRIHPDDIERAMAGVSESATQLSQWHDEYRYLHPQKGERWFEGRSLPILEADGSVLWHGYVEDVTRRKGEERRIAELNDFQRLLMDAVPALISYVDSDFHYVKVNRGYERWFGHPAAEVEGRSVREVLGDEAWNVVAPKLRRALTGESIEYEAEVPYKDGGTRWVRVSYFPDFNAAERVRGIVAMVVDITERRRVEDELRRSRRQYSELIARQDGIRDAERRHIAREVHDELGQLLTGMRMTLSALRLRSDPKRSDVTRTAEQLEKMLDETTDIVRRISANLHATVVEHGLLPALEVLATEFRDMSHVACRLTVGGEIPPLGQTLAMTVFRIAQESLTNIARHARAKSVSLHLSCDAGTLRLAVHDDGRGFDPDAVRQSGSGLGLFGMQERAAMAGGRLRVVSSHSHGTRLEVELPLPAKADT